MWIVPPVNVTFVRQHVGSGSLSSICLVAIAAAFAEVVVLTFVVPRDSQLLSLVLLPQLREHLFRAAHSTAHAIDQLLAEPTSILLISVKPHLLPRGLLLRRAADTGTLIIVIMRVSSWSSAKSSSLLTGLVVQELHKIPHAYPIPLKNVLHVLLPSLVCLSFFISAAETSMSTNLDVVIIFIVPIPEHAILWVVTCF